MERAVYKNASGIRPLFNWEWLWAAHCHPAYLNLNNRECHWALHLIRQGASERSVMGDGRGIWWDLSGKWPPNKPLGDGDGSLRGACPSPSTLLSFVFLIRNHNKTIGKVSNPYRICTGKLPWSEQVLLETTTRPLPNAEYVDAQQNITLPRGPTILEFLSSHLTWRRLRVFLSRRIQLSIVTSRKAEENKAHPPHIPTF